MVTHQLQLECRTGKVRQQRPVFHHCAMPPTKARTWLWPGPGPSTWVFKGKDRNRDCSFILKNSQGLHHWSEDNRNVDWYHSMWACDLAAYFCNWCNGINARSINENSYTSLCLLFTLHSLYIVCVLYCQWLEWNKTGVDQRPRTIRVKNSPSCCFRLDYDGAV